MRILVTGANGFVGRYLMPALNEAGHEILAMDRDAGTPGSDAADYFAVDISNSEDIDRVVRSAEPDACVHLAAISFVPTADADPRGLYAVNVMGTANVLEAFHRNRPQSRILVVSTSQVYARNCVEPVTEDSPIQPQNFYGASKASADMLALTYAERFGMDVMIARPSNHIGPGQAPTFAVSSFAQQVKAVADGTAHVITTGNIDSERHFLDVRDVVLAYRLLLEKGHPGLAYNISGPERYRIRRILEELCGIAGIEPRFETDEDKYRPTDKSPQLDITRIRSHTGWQPRLSIHDTLRDIYSQL